MLVAHLVKVVASLVIWHADETKHSVSGSTVQRAVVLLVGVYLRYNCPGSTTEALKETHDGLPQLSRMRVIVPQWTCCNAM